MKISVLVLQVLMLVLIVIALALMVTNKQTQSIPIKIPGMASTIFLKKTATFSQITRVQRRLGSLPPGQGGGGGAIKTMPELIFDHRLEQLEQQLEEELQATFEPQSPPATVPPPQQQLFKGQLWGQQRSTKHQQETNLVSAVTVKSIRLL
ncbi:hypothetical protein SELMODRAFT_426331 [Selaginella moellendorffii]|uniref:Uncharacterized protein n=1 Tax=Selaginella moellendorffii TaxID=88036 RepID=D8SW19_SELML|nr:hypothetical protein SELMODRAFT_426331 [Selaginella moellendorffii]